MKIGLLQRVGNPVLFESRENLENEEGHSPSNMQYAKSFYSSQQQRVHFRVYSAVLETRTTYNRPRDRSSSHSVPEHPFQLIISRIKMEDNTNKIKNRLKQRIFDP